MKKYAFITGGNGGIGSAAVTYLKDRGYHCVLPLRSEEKIEGYRMAFGVDSETTLFVSQLIHAEELEAQLKTFKEEGIVFSVVFLAAGRFAWDKDFEGENDEEKQKNSIDALYEANVTTKKVPITALHSVYADALQDATLVVISSHAAHFDDEHELRKGEEGYVQAMQYLSNYAREVEGLGMFKAVVLEEPGRIGTESAKSAFTKDTIGTDVNWEEEKSPETYIKEVFASIEL